MRSHFALAAIMSVWMGLRQNEANSGMSTSQFIAIAIMKMSSVVEDFSNIICLEIIKYVVAKFYS